MVPKAKNECTQPCNRNWTVWKKLFLDLISIVNIALFGIKVLGDEVHFVMMCPQFQEDRKCLESKIANLYPNVI